MKIFDHESGKFYTGSPDSCLKEIKSFIDSHEVKIKKRILTSMRMKSSTLLERSFALDWSMFCHRLT